MSLVKVFALFIFVGLFGACSDTAGDPTTPKTNEDSTSSPRLAPQAVPLYESIKAYLSATDSAAMLDLYGRSDAILKGLYASYDHDFARELSVSAHTHAYAEFGDTEWQRSSEILGGHMFACSGDGSGKVVLIFVNGVFNSTDAALDSCREIALSVSKAGLSDRVDVYNYYNPSARFVGDSKAICILRAIQALDFTDVLKCNGYLGDLFEANSQISSLVNNLPAEVLPEVRGLTQKIRDERSAGKAVILIGHSQGNLMIAQALQQLGSFDPLIAVVALASPVGKSSFVPWSGESLSGFVVAGSSAQDVILTLGYNDFPRIATNVSLIADSIARVWSNPNLAVAVAPVLVQEQNFRLHLMVESYMAGRESEGLFESLMKTDVGRLVGLIDNPPPPPPAVHEVYAVGGHVSFNGIALGSGYLWKVGLSSTGKDSLIGQIRTSDGSTPLITDIAEHPFTGELWATGEDRLYTIDKHTAIALPRATFTNVNVVNAAGFDAQGKLYVADRGGRMNRVDLDAMQIEWSHSMGLGIISAGDIAVGPDGRVFVMIEDDYGDDHLAVLGREDYPELLCATGHNSGNVWSLTFVGDTLYGMTAPKGEDHGSLLVLNTAGCGEQFVRSLSFSSFGSVREK